jgi:hypothetical protein
MVELLEIIQKFKWLLKYLGHGLKPWLMAFKNQSQSRRLWKAVQKAWLGLAFHGWLWLA